MSRRPIRDRFENLTDKVPSGPRGNIGEGDVIGAAGFFAVEASKPVVEFIPGVKQPGYKVTGHGTRRTGEGEEHTINIAAISEDVAKWAAQYSASPSNVNFVVSDKEIVNVEEVTKRQGYSTYQIKVLLKDPPTLGDGFDEDEWSEPV